MVKLKVVVELAKLRPSSVRVSDKLGNSVLISAEYPQLPPKCGSCGEFGHFDLRCPEAIERVEALIPYDSVPLEIVAGSPVIQSESPFSPSTSHIQTNHHHSSSLVENADSSSGGWIRVAHRSKPTHFKFRGCWCFSS